jgi:hypothetical protein
MHIPYSDRCRRRLAPALTVATMALVVLAGRAAAQASETYDTAKVDAAGRLTVITADRREIHIPVDSDQVGIDRVGISPDHRTAGWLALFPNCCTSYPIPLKLVLLSGRGDTLVHRHGLACLEVGV